jgi:hypothetical protein
MTVTGPAVTLQVRDDDKVLEPQRAWARTRPRGCWSGRGSPSFRGTASGRPAPDSSGSTSPPVPRCSPKPWNASREQPVLGDGDWISAMTVLSGRGLGNRHRADPRAARWRPDPSRQGHREIPGTARLRRRRRRPGQLPPHCPEAACRLPGDRKRPAVTEVGQVGGVAQALGHGPGTGASRVSRTVGEGSQNLLCAYLAGAVFLGVFLGLVANIALGWWWLDGAVVPPIGRWARRPRRLACCLRFEGRADVRPGAGA